jgi:hypothetical protein
MRQRPLDGLPQALLDLVQPAHVVPGDVGHVDKYFAHRRRFHFPQRLLKIAHLDLELG